MNPILNEKLITHILKNYDGYINKNPILIIVAEIVITYCFSFVICSKLNAGFILI